MCAGGKSIVDPFFTNIDLASKVMSATVAAHEVYSSNIANLSTPGFTAQKPSFEMKLNRAKVMAQKQADALIGGASFLEGPAGSSAWEMKAKVTPSKEAGNEHGNNVKMDREFVAMSENNILYLATLRILSKEVALTKYAITTGGR